MKKRTLLIALAMLLCLAVGAAAAGGLQEIKAYLDQDITVRYDGQAQAFTDASGKTVYPISYNGTTYLPVRAVAGLFGVDVDWDQTTRTVLLGRTGAQDFIDTLKPYSAQPYANCFALHQTAGRKTETIAGREYTHWIELSTNGGGYYDLGGKYSTLTVQTYCEFDATVYFYGDNDALLGSVEITASHLPVTTEIDVTGVQQLLIAGEHYPADSGLIPIYLFNAVIE